MALTTPWIAASIHFRTQPELRRLLDVARATSTRDYGIFLLTYWSIREPSYTDLNGLSCKAAM